jgi:RimJ/RimL family protein N-acetyltransferase
MAEQNASLVGSVALIDDGQSLGQLRWFLVVPSVRGQGLGRRMLGAAISFGFVVTDEKRGQVWGAQRTELRMQLALVLTAGS